MRQKLLRNLAVGLCLVGGTVGMGTAQAPVVWKTYWVQHPTAPTRDPVVLHFRKVIKVGSVPQHFVVHVSADRRFIFYTNGKRVGAGPAQGDPMHWRYETFDLAPLLHAGSNTLSAVVWNWGVYSPLSLMSDRTAFLVQGDAETNGVADTGMEKSPWMVKMDAGRGVYTHRAEGRIHDYYAVGAGESFSAADYEWDWQDAGLSLTGWVESVRVPLGNATAVGQIFAHTMWRLMPDTLPQMTYDDAGVETVVASTLDSVGKGAMGKIVVPAHTTARVILDRKQIVTAYPEINFSGGVGSEVKITYAEALYDKALLKGNRDAVEGREALGFQDDVWPDGGAGRVFEPLWYRCWRYLQLDITTGDAALTLDGVKAHETMFPFERKASFKSPDPELQKIFDIGWWTLRLDSHETFVDTPYYEQQQYEGDTRIDSLIAYSVADDDRLALQAHMAFSASRIDGIPQSRYPSTLVQSIPPFALLWIGMLHDSYMYRPDPARVRGYLQATRDTLGWFHAYQREDGMLTQPTGWNFVDWVPQGVKVPTYDRAGVSCLLSLQLLGAYEDASDLERNLGDAGIAAEYDKRMGLLKKSIYSSCWSDEKGLLADTPDKKMFSEHGQILASLFDVLPTDKQARVLGRVLANHALHNDQEDAVGKEGMIPASYYFRFYLSRALEHAGMGDRYIESLQPWRELLPMGFTAWPEQPDDTRSDAHAFSAHPTFDLLEIVGGIGPGSAGFATVKVAPHLAELPWLTVAYPSPKGMIRAHYEQENGKLKVEVTLPAGLPGTFEWKGQTRGLHAGANQFELIAAGTEGR